VLEQARHGRLFEHSGGDSRVVAYRANEFVVEDELPECSGKLRHHVLRTGRVAADGVPVFDNPDDQDRPFPSVPDLQMLCHDLFEPVP